MTVGSFIISLDCEAKWGMADHLGPRHQTVLVDERIRQVYRQIVALFGDFDVSATFAFVAIFLMDRRGGKDLLDRLDAPEGSALWRWLSAYREEWETGAAQGWHAPELAEIVGQAGHEIAAHGLTHLPLSQADVTDAEAVREIAGAREAMTDMGLEPPTYIFARNEQKCVSAIADAGYLGFRESRAASSRLLTLAQEFVPSMSSQGHIDTIARPTGSTIPVPAGLFMNFHFGPRALVPRPVTVSRWKRSLDHTSATGGVTHLWFHPHNLLFDPGATATLRPILAHAARLRDRGALHIETQAQYAARRLEGGHQPKSRQ